MVHKTPPIVFQTVLGAITTVFLLTVVLPEQGHAGKGFTSTYLVAYLSKGTKLDEEGKTGVTLGLAHIAEWDSAFQAGEYVVLSEEQGIFDNNVTVNESVLEIALAEKSWKSHPILWGTGHIQTSPRGERRPGKRDLLLQCPESIEAPIGLSLIDQRIDRCRFSWTLVVEGKGWSSRVTLSLIPESEGLHVKRWWDEKQLKEEFTLLKGRIHGNHRSWDKDGKLMMDSRCWFGRYVTEEEYQKLTSQGYTDLLLTATWTQDEEVELKFRNTGKIETEIEIPSEGSGSCDRYFDVEAELLDGALARKSMSYVPLVPPCVVRLQPHGLYAHRIRPRAYLNNVELGRLKRLRITYVNPLDRTRTTSDWVETANKASDPGVAPAPQVER